jgi:hypothetical protein
MPYNFDGDKLNEIVKKVDEYYLNSLPRDENITYHFSPRFEKKVKKLIKQNNKKEDNKKSYLFRKRLAIRIVSILILQLLQ